MDIFPDPPRLYVKRPYWYVLKGAYRYQWVYDRTEYRITIEEGFCTDLASTPKWLWWLISPQDLWLGPPLIHDFLYHVSGDVSETEFGWSEKKEGDQWVPTSEWTRTATDRLFGRHMREAGVRRCRRRLAYLGVRMGGFTAWSKTRKGDEPYC